MIPGALAQAARVRSPLGRAHHSDHGTALDAADAPLEIGPAQFLLPLLCFVALLTVPAVLFVAPVLGEHPTLDLPALLFAVATVYSAARLSMLMWRARPRWLTLGFWIFTYCWIAVAGLIQALANANPLDVTLTRGEQLTQALVVVVGMICFDLAQALTPVAHAAPRRILLPSRVLLLGWVSVVLTPLFVYVLGGPTALLSSRDAVYNDLRESGLYSASTNAVGGTLATFANCMPYVALLCVAKVLVDNPEVRGRLSPRILFALLLASNLLINNPISNSRFWAFTVILGVLYLWRRMARPLVMASFVTVFALSSLTVFPYLDATRVDAATAAQYHLKGNDYDQPVDYVLNKTDYGAVTDIGIGLRVADDGLRWGKQLLGDVTFWVPRSWWPNKPDNTAALISNKIQFSNTNLDSPLWIEGYIDFGWAGTALFLAAAGATAARLDQALIRARAMTGTAVPMLAVLVPAVAGYEFILLRGSLLQAMARIVIMVALFWVISGRQDRSPRPASSTENQPRLRLTPPAQQTTSTLTSVTTRGNQA